MNIDFTHSIDCIIRMAPAGWVSAVTGILKGYSPSATTDEALIGLPVTHNADLAHLITEVIKNAPSYMGWEALGCTIETAFVLYQRWNNDQHVELLWSGPSPANQIPARRIDQALYDLIANAKREILLVTFAAAKIERLTNELLKAVQRGVRVRLILEFEQTSEGQLSYDALKAFPSVLVTAVEVFCWPIEKRERNPAGRPGKLHAKVAIIDDTALVSSANLTDDAFNRNLELGVMVKNPDFLSSVKGYVDTMVTDGMLVQL